MKSLSEIKAKLEAVEGGGEVYEAVVAVVDAEKQAGIKAAKKLKGDVATYGKYKDAVEELGFDGTVDVPDFVAALKGKLEKGGDEGEVAKLRRDLAKATKAQGEFQEQLTRERGKRHATILKDTILGGLRDEKGQPKVYGADLLANELVTQGRVKLLDDERTVVFVDGDNETPFGDGMKAVLEQRKDLVRNPQRGGAGSSGGGDEGGKTITRAAFEQLSPQDKIATVREGTQVTD